MRRIITYILTGLLLSGCEFKPLNYEKTPEPILQLHLKVKKPYGLLATALRNTIPLVNNAQSPYTIEIIKNIFDYKNPIIGSSSQTRIFIYRYQVSYRIIDMEQHTIIPTHNLELKRNLIINRDETLESTPYLKQLKEKMAFDISRQIRTLLLSKKTLTTLRRHHEVKTRPTR